VSRQRAPHTQATESPLRSQAQRPLKASRALFSLTARHDAWNGPGKKNIPKQVRAAFLKYDADGSGDIDAAELREALDATGIKVNDGAWADERCRTRAVGERG
jgi:hypothetical protein